MSLEPGARLDTYELLQPLDAGGMGEVWVARDTSLGRKVALKLLPVELTEDATRVARFQQEARLASSLNHPNICTIYALGELPDSRQFIAMELIEGTNLRQRLGGAQLARRDALDIAIQMASALTAAHAAGVVHRDVKPENVMVRPDGVVKVLDFGLAKFASTEPTTGTEPTRTVLRTDAGTVMGTVAYMSPEQARGQEVDARTDIWSLGAVLYEATAGRRPFPGQTSSDVLAGILEREPDPLVRFAQDTPAELQRIVSKTLRKDREQRYQSMKDLLLDLQALRESSQSSAGHLVAPVARRKVLMALIALFVVVAAAGGAWWALRNGHAANETTRTASVQRNLTRLTFDPGLQTDATWSPDGRFIAYASDKAGNFDIWVQPVAGGDAVQVTKSPAQDTEPDWSPDGSTIVFRSERDGGGLFVVPSLGGTERRITSFGVQAKWSRDGSQILFTSAPEGTATYVVSLDGSLPHLILQGFANEDLLWVFSRAWHPDSRRVSILGETRTQGFGLYTVPLASGPPVVTGLTGLESLEANAVQFQWAPSGEALVFEGRLNSVSNLWRMTVDPKSLAAGSLERLTTGGGNDTGVALSRDGKYAAFTSQADSTRLWLFPFDAAVGRITGVGRPVTAATTAVMSPQLAPDGHRIAYALVGVGARTWELWTEDVMTGDKQQLARDQFRRGGPTWSPEGSRLAYAWNSSAGGTIAVRPAAGGDERLLSDPLRDRIVTTFGWSPDGQSVLVSSNVSTGKQVAVALWPLAGAPHADKAERVLASNPDYNLWQESFSPNGRWIAFQAVTTRPGGTSTLYVIPGAGGKDANWTPLTDPHVWADKPRWSPDGKLLYFWLRQGSLHNVWALHFDDAHGTVVGTPFQVTRFDSRARHITTFPIGNSDPSLSATSLLLPMTDTTGSIWMLDNVDK